jgi:hypothetical protein
MRPVLELLQGGNPDDICARYSISREELEKRFEAFQISRRQAELIENLSLQRVGRNDPCPCGSGKKYKKCCLAKHEEARKSIPADQLQELEERARLKEKLEKDVADGFDLFFAQDFDKARRFALRQLETYPEDDRFHDILTITSLATGDYDGAFHTCQLRWQVAREEKDFFLENGYHQREGMDKKRHVYLYSPSTWLEKLWISQRARAYSGAFPADKGAPLASTVRKLLAANDVKRFPSRQEEGYEARRQALAPVLKEIEAGGAAAIPHLLPLTYTFSWASLFVPDLLGAIGTDESVKLLAELSMFQFPFFSQKCLMNLERFGERAAAQIKQVLEEDPDFDELKVGIIMVLGSVETKESLDILAKLIEHDNTSVVNWAAQALNRQKNPEALVYFEKAKERLGDMSKIGGAIRDLAGKQGA